MAQQQQGQCEHQERNIGFKSVQLFKDQTLGIGSYGAVCKAKCDDLLCAAKILHPTLFDPTVLLQVSPKQEHRLPIKRFEQECEFLSTIRHPNIVQYLCMHQDPDTGLPVLLMELMDESLTHFLESSPQPIAYHTQVNICHDITLALSFLHSNGIIHRDLSSNNVLLRGNILAKVTDFGMAMLGDLNPQATRYTFTMCPGTDVYMPPEAVQDEPVYTEKIDCFSFGVIVVQILTRKFPKPGNLWHKIQISHPKLPRGTMAVRVAEVNRRQNHISQVDRSHPLLSLALDCLKDEDVERPSAQQLCERVDSLKNRLEYSDSVAAAQQERQLLRQLQQLQQVHREESQQKDQQLEKMREQVQKLQRSLGEVEKMRQQLDSQQLTQQREIEEKERQLQQLREQLQLLQQESAGEREAKEIQMEQIGQQLHQLQEILTIERNETKRKLQQYLAFRIKTTEQITVRDERERQLTQQIESLRLERGKLEKRLSELEEQLQGQTEELQWSKGGEAPFADRRRRDAIVDGNRAYFLDGNGKIWIYEVSNKYWSQLSIAPYFGSSLTILNSLPTTVGGDLTNKLMSFATAKGCWTELFPPMSTRRIYATLVRTETSLIVVGGTGVNYKNLTTVEVLNIETHEWFTAVNLPEPLYSCSASVCGDRLYLLGGICNIFPFKSVYSCSLSTLFQTCTQRLECVNAQWLSNCSGGTVVWSKLAELPVRESTCVTFYEELLAIGGEDSDNNTVTGVYIYSPSSNSWNAISHINRARKCPFVAVLPDNQLMVVGGEIDNDGTLTNSIEFGNLV